MDYDLTIDQGSTFILSIEVKDDNGNIDNLTDDTFLMQIRDYWFSPDVIIEASTVNGMITVIPLSGAVSVKLPPVETIKLTKNIAHYDLIRTRLSGDQSVVVRGKIDINFRVSR